MKKKVILPLLTLTIGSLTGCGPKYNFSDEDYSYMLLSDLVGPAGTLTITKDVATITKNGEEKKLFPTEVKVEPISYQKVIAEDITKTITENLIVCYYGGARNDADYRITFSASEFKRVELQKKNGENWEVQATFVPQTPEFAGAYNGVGYYHDSNIVYIISNELTKTLDKNYYGYEVASYHASSGSLGRDTFLLVPGFYLYQNKFGTQVYKGADMLDLSDHQFFNNYWYAAPNDPNISYFTASGIKKNYFFADASIFLSTIVDTEGNRYNNSYTQDADGKLINIKVNGQNAGLVTKRTETGLVHEFYIGEDKTYVDIYPGQFRFKNGNTVKTFASMKTWYDESEFPCLEFVSEPERFISGDQSDSFDMYYASFDWDKEVETDLTYAWNNKPTDYTVKATTEGYVELTFTDSTDGKITIRRGNDNIIIVNKGDVTSYSYRVKELRRLFADTLVNPAENISIVVSKDLKYSLNGAEPVKAEFGYLTGYGISMKCGDYIIVPSASKYNTETKKYDYFGYMLLSETVSTYLVRQSLLKEIEGTYTNDGTHTFEFLNGKILVNGVEVEYELTMLQNQQTMDYALAFEYKLNGETFYAMPGDGSFSIFNASFQMIGYYVTKSVFDTLLGNYVYYGDFGKEYVRFRDDGKLILDCLNADGTGLVRDVEANSFTVNVTEDYTSITASVTLPSGQTGTLPMFKDEGAIIIGDLIYLEEALYDLQGLYGDGSENAIMIYQNAVYINTGARAGDSTRQTIESIKSVKTDTGRKDTITTLDYVIEATYENEELVSLSYYDVEEGETSRINLLIEDNSRIFEEQFGLTREKSGTVEKFSALFTNEVKEGKVKVDVLYKYNDMKPGGYPIINGVCYHDGHISANFNFAGFKFYLYMVGDTPTMDVVDPVF